MNAGITTVQHDLFIFSSHPNTNPNINSGHFLHKYPRNPVSDLAQFRGCEDKEVARREERVDAAFSHQDPLLLKCSLTITDLT